MFYILYSLASWLIVPLVLGMVVFFIVRRGKNKKGQDDHIQIALSKEDAISQFFFLFSLFFFGVALLAFNREFTSNWLSWQSIVLTTSLIGLGVTYYFKVIFPLIFSMFGVIIWWMFKASEWTDIANGDDIRSSGMLALFVLISLLLYLLGRSHELNPQWKRFSVIYLVFGMIFIVGLLFALSTNFGLNLLENATSGVSIFGSWQLIISLMLLVVAIVVTIAYNLIEKLISYAEVAIISIIGILFGVFVFVPAQNLFSGSGPFGGLLTGLGYVWAIIFNVLLLVIIIGIIFLGYNKREKWLINLGILSTFIFIFVKYFDWFFALLSRSVFFLSAGILLFVVVWFMQRGKRYMMEEMQEDIQNSDNNIELKL